jgi:hypothetical protein
MPEQGEGPERPKGLALYFGNAMVVAAFSWFVGWGITVANTDPPLSRTYWIWPSYVALGACVLGLALVLFTHLRNPRSARVPEPTEPLSAFARGDYSNAIFEDNVTDADVFLDGVSRDSVFSRNRQRRR